MYKNIVLTGGNTQIANFTDRMAFELRRLAPNSSLPIQLHARYDREYASWLGGAVFTSLPPYQQMLVTQDMYNEYGAKALANRYQQINARTF